MPSLTYIKRGGVRIQNNPLLCYADSIEWTAIADNTTPDEHWISGNKKANECPVCPAGKNVTATGELPNPELSCPQSPTDTKKHVCWNRQMCQKLCPAACGNRTCTALGECCDASCVSGCTQQMAGSTKFDVCESCRFLRFRTPSGGVQCLEKCPLGYYNYNDYRCVTAVECRNMTLPFTVSSTQLVRAPYVPFRDHCRTTCPTNHTMVEDKDTELRQCEKCNGTCKRDCKSGTIDSIGTAQNFRGCNRINGNLHIQIRNQGGREFVENCPRGTKNPFQLCPANRNQFLFQ